MVRSLAVYRGRDLSRLGCEPDCEPARSFHFGRLPFPVYPPQEEDGPLYFGRRNSWRHSSTHRLGGSVWHLECGCMDTLCNSLPLAISSLYGHRMDISRGL